MFTVATLILLFCKPNMKEVPESSVFKAGIVSAIALFGLAWLTDTFILEWETQIVDTVGGWVNDYQAVFFFGVFLIAALTTSQSTATRTIVPIGLAVGLSPAAISAHVGGRFRRHLHAADERLADRRRQLRRDRHDQARHEVARPLVHHPRAPARASPRRSRA